MRLQFLLLVFVVACGAPAAKPTSAGPTDPTTTATFARPTLMKVGVGMVIGGVVLLALPSNAKKVAPEVQVGPKGVSATKTVSW